MIMICQFSACRFNCNDQCDNPRVLINLHGVCSEVEDEESAKRLMRERAAADIIHIYSAYKQKYPVNYDDRVALAVAALLNDTKV